MDDRSEPKSVAFMFPPNVAAHLAPPSFHVPVLSPQRQISFRKDEALFLFHTLSTAVREPDGILLSHKSPPNPETLREDSHQRIQPEAPDRLDKVGGEGLLLGGCLVS